MINSLKLYILTLALFLISSHSLAANRPPIMLQGFTPAEVKDLKNKYPNIDKENLSLAVLDQVVRYLMTTEQFTSVLLRKRNKNSKQLILEVKSTRRVGRITINGNRHLNRDQILKVLNLKRFGTLRTDELELSLDRLREKYRQDGYFNIKAEVRMRPTTRRMTDLEVVIDEGQSCRITDIDFQTENKKLKGQLRRISTGVMRERYSEVRLSQLQTRISSFLSDNRYLTTRISEPTIEFNSDKTEVRILYTIENPYEYEFLIDNNTSIKDSSIIRQFDLGKYSGQTFSPSGQLAQKIKEIYLEKGFANVEVTFKEEYFKKKFRQRVRFKVKENNRIRIRSIRVEGKISRPSFYYANYIRENSSTLVRQSFYNREAIDKGAKLLIDQLQNEGFLRAEVLSIRPQFNKKKEVVDIFVNLDEGPLTQIQKIQFEGIKALSRNQILDALDLKAGKPLRLNSLQPNIDKIMKLYRSKGYLEVQVSNSKKDLISYNQNYTLAVVRFKVREGPQIVVNSIRVDGNTFTKESVVLRELEFKEGDILTPELLSESIIRLQKIGLFSRVQISTLEEGSKISQRTVRVQVVERDPGLFSLGLGITNEQQISFRGFTGLAYRNLYGTGRKVFSRLDLQYSTDPDVSFLENEVTISYLEPAVFSDRTQLRISLIRAENALDPEEGDVNITIQENNEINFLLEREFSKRLKASWNLYSFSNQRFFDRVTRADERTINIGTIGPIFEYDLRNNITVPTEGSYTRLEVEYSDPLLGSSQDALKFLRFARVTGNYTYYKPLFSPKWVWYNSFRSGYVAPLTDDDRSGVPGEKAFFLGGRTTIRGFDLSSSERIPRLSRLGVTEIDDFFLSTDSYFYLVKSEIRFPIYDIVGGLVFYDGGAVHITGTTFDDPFRDSAGFGLRIIIPGVGTISAEYGFKLDRYQDFSIPGNPLNENEGSFHFSFSTF